MVDLSGKTAVVTGASRGIGASAARELAKAGAKVVLAARSADAIGDIADEITAAGGAAMACTCNVARIEDVVAVVEMATAEFGRLDILVNNAGVIEPIARLDESDPDGWSEAFDINLKGVYNGLRAALPLMRAQAAGVIINVSSGAATSPLEGWSHYCASKAAALMLTRCAHVECEGQGIRVVGLSPGTVATDMQVVIKQSGVNPVSALDPSVHIPPEWVGRAIAWLATDNARAFDGDDVRLREPEIRARIGLPESHL